MGHGQIYSCKNLSSSNISTLRWRVLILVAIWIFDYISIGKFPDLFAHLEQISVLPDRMPVGHAGDVIRDGPGLLEPIVATVLLGEQTRLIQERREQVAHDAPR